MLILIDFSNVARACWHPAQAAALADAKYDPHQVFKTNLRLKMGTIEKDVSPPPGAIPVMVMDSRSEWKRAVFAGYKANRKSDDFDPRPEAERYLREAFPSVRWAVAPGFEADDAIATLARDNRDQHEVVIVSTDKDLWQLIQRNVHVYLPTKRKFVTQEMVVEEFEVSDPSHIRLHKALWGDASDNVPNCAPRMQRQLLPIIREADGDLFRALELADGRVNATCLGHLRKNQEQLVVNWELVKLEEDVDVEWR